MNHYWATVNKYKVQFPDMKTAQIRSQMKSGELPYVKASKQTEPKGEKKKRVISKTVEKIKMLYNTIEAKIEVLPKKTKTKAKKMLKQIVTEQPSDKVENTIVKVTEELKELNDTINKVAPKRTNKIFRLLESIERKLTLVHPQYSKAAYDTFQTLKDELDSTPTEKMEEKLEELEQEFEYIPKKRIPKPVYASDDVD